MHHNLIVFNLHFVACKRVEGGRLFQITTRDVETRMMPGTNDALAAKYTFDKRRAVVSAMRANGVKVSAHAR